MPKQFKKDTVCIEVIFALPVGDEFWTITFPSKDLTSPEAFKAACLETFNSVGKRSKRKQPQVASCCVLLKFSDPALAKVVTNPKHWFMRCSGKLTFV